MGLGRNTSTGSPRAFNLFPRRTAFTVHSGVAATANTCHLGRRGSRAHKLESCSRPIHGRNHSVRSVRNNPANRQPHRAEGVKMLPKNNVAFASRHTAGNGYVDAHAVVTKWRASPLPAENWPPTKQLKGVSLPLGQQSNEANRSFPRVGVFSAWHERLRLLPWKEKQAPGHAYVLAVRARVCPRLQSVRPRRSGFLWLWQHTGHGDHAADVSAGADDGPLERLRMRAIVDHQSDHCTASWRADRCRQNLARLCAGCAF